MQKVEVCTLSSAPLVYHCVSISRTTTMSNIYSCTGIDELLQNMAEYDEKFNWVDYLVFALSLAITLIVGLTIAFMDKWHKQNAESYLMANRKMNWFLVGLSFLNTSQSAMSFIAIPTEYYFYGFGFVFSVIGYYIGAILTAIIIIPKFYRLGFLVTSAYEYFEHRFNLVVRMMVGICYVLVSLLGLGVSLYIPSLVLSSVSDISLEWCIVIGAVVCLIYTAFGGMKAVIFVDSIQVFIIAAGFLTLAVKAVNDAGGMSKVWEIYTEIGERNNWRDLNPEPWNRHSLWNVIFLLGILLFSSFGTNQAQLQRYMTTPSVRKAQISIIFGITVSLLFVALIVTMALVSFALFGGNDPLLTGKIDEPDQIIPLLLMTVLGHMHGLPGLVIAALYAAALSTISSGQSAIVAVFNEDIILPIYKLVNGKPLNERVTGIIVRSLGIVVGIGVLGMALVIPIVGGTLFELSLTIETFFYGPVLGLMMCGFFCFWIEQWGATVGFMSSIGWAIMMFYGNRKYGSGIGKEKMPLFTANFTHRVDFIEPTADPTLFDTSYIWYVLMDVVVLTVVATIISLIVHLIKHGRLKHSDMMPDKTFRYTIDDFLVATGIRKNDRIAVSKHDRKKMDSGYINDAYVESTHL